MNDSTLQILAVITISLGFVNMGSVLYFPSAIIADTEEYGSTIYGSHIALTAVQKDMMGSFIGLGALTATVLLPLISKVCGGRELMIIMGIMAIISWLGIALCPWIIGILAFRYLAGAFVGIVSIVGTNYNIETVDSRVREVLCGFISFSIVVGLVFCAVLNYWFHYYHVAMLSCVCPSLFLLGLFYVPESPRYLVLRGNENRTQIVFSRLNNSDTDADKEYQENQNLNNISKENSYHGLGEPKIIRKMLAIITLFFIRGFGGFELFIANSFRIFQNIGSILDEKMACILLYLFQLPSSLIFTFLLVDRMRRRKCLLLSHSIVAVTLMYLALHSFITEEADISSSDALQSVKSTSLNSTNLSPDYLLMNDTLQRIHEAEQMVTSYWSYVPVGFAALCLTGFYCGLQGVPFLLMAECFPSTIRPKVATVCLCCSAFFQFAALQLYTPIVSELTASGLYMLMAMLVTSGLVFTYFFVEEGLMKN